MDLKYIRSIINDPPETTTDYFMKSYRTCESYFNRILFIGLRLKGIKYSQAEGILRTTFIPIRDSLGKGLQLIDDKKSEQILKQKAVQDAYRLFLSFSSPYRNLVSHGVFTEINDKRTLELLVKTNVKLLKELEHELGRVFNHSAFDKPKDWGAKKSNRVYTENEIRELKLGYDAKEPISTNEAEKRYNNIDWLH